LLGFLKPCPVSSANQKLNLAKQFQISENQEELLSEVLEKQVVNRLLASHEMKSLDGLLRVLKVIEL
jgi:hypothetical protein